MKVVKRVLKAKTNKCQKKLGDKKNEIMKITMCVRKSTILN